MIASVDVAVTQEKNSHIESQSYSQPFVYSEASSTPPNHNGAQTNDDKAEAQLVRYIGANSSGWNLDVSDGSMRNLSDLYTRIELISDAGSNGAGAPGASGSSSNPNLRNYNSENRGWLARLWEGKTDTVTTLANVEVKDPELKLAIPLFSISHASSRDMGNTWATNFTASNVESPLFRVGPNTAITIHLNAKASSDLKSQGASLIVGAVTQAVKIAVPSSELLSTLSKPEISNTAQAIDTTLSSLFSQEITEDMELGRFTDTWNPGATLKFIGCAPLVQTDEDAKRANLQQKTAQTAPDKTGIECSNMPDDDGNYDTLVGSWTMKLHCPRFSVFDSSDICHTVGGVSPCPSKTTSCSGATIDLSVDNLKKIYPAIAGSVSDDQILQFSLSSQVTIAQFVLAQDWYTNFIRSKSKANGAPASTNGEADAASTFCGSALNSLYGSGLNKFDAALVLRAMVNDLPGLLGRKSEFVATGTGTTCQSLVSNVSVSLDSNASAQSTDATAAPKAKAKPKAKTKTG